MHSTNRFTICFCCASVSYLTTYEAPLGSSSNEERQQLGSILWQHPNMRTNPCKLFNKGSLPSFITLSLSGCMHCV
uniref:Secreted protein n=1 Tax=Mola mola TaxID=94237 RepID=A0A3Q4AB57_MOLML